MSEAVDDTAIGERGTRSMAVLLRRDGVFLPSTAHHGIFPLSAEAIVLLAELARPTPVDADAAVKRVAARFGVPRRPLYVTLELARRRGFLSTGPAEAGDATSATAPVPDRTAGPPVEPSDSLVVGAARLVQVVDGRFRIVDHWGAPIVELGPIELAAVGRISAAADNAAALEIHREKVGDEALSADELLDLASLMLSVGVLEREEECRAKTREQAIQDRSFTKGLKAREAMRAYFEEEVARVDALAASTGRPRVHVVPIHSQFTTPLSLGVIVAYAEKHDGGRLLDDYGFLPSSFFNLDFMQRHVEDGAMFLYSNYVWSHGSNLETSARVKEINPRCLNIHGGPDSPKYGGDVEAYFEANPFVDVVVHGEGEVTFSEMLTALAPGIHDEVRDMSVLSEVPGLSYRTPDGVVTTGPRDRLTDLDVIPSPYLEGLYKAYEDGGIDTAMIETNRGCPYSCTFCDWGSSTASRIRKFDLERVFAELEWCAKAKVEKIFLCDANFGIFERDVEIAKRFAELRQQYGYPRGFTTNYAKNTVKHLSTIVKVMAEAGVVTEGLLSLQSMDDDTLKTIRRSNIKVEKYDALAAEFREARLPLWVDLMIGLPGQTPTSVREDFQQCIDREVNAKVFQTELLVNSPMNDPEYREEHRIVAERADGAPAPRIPVRGSTGTGRALVVSSTSFTREDYDEMLEMRGVFRLVENFAVLRLVARFIRQEVGLREADLMERLRTAARDHADRWPHLSLAMRVVPEHMLPPVSWHPFIEDIRSFAVEELGVQPGSALEAVLAAQHAVLPAPGRDFPFSVDLPHDVGAWYRDVLVAKDRGARSTWTDEVEPLATYLPTTFTVDDPEGLCRVGLGFGIDVDPYASWELHSPVTRALALHHTLLA